MADLLIMAAVAAAVAAASYTLSYVLTPKPKPAERGRLQGQLQVQDSSYGSMIPLIVGGDMGDGSPHGIRVAGNVIYLSDIRAVETVVPATGGGGHGKGGGGGASAGSSQPIKETTYYIDIGICFGQPGAGGELELEALFAATDLIYDVRATMQGGHDGGPTGTSATYEAEESVNRTYSGTTTFQQYAAASQGYEVTMGPSATVQFNNVRANYTGIRDLTIYYRTANSTSIPISVQVNGGDIANYTLPTTDETYQPYTVQISVNEGNNTVKITNGAGASNLGLDRVFCYAGPPSGGSPSVAPVAPATGAVNPNVSADDTYDYENPPTDITAATTKQKQRYGYTAISNVRNEAAATIVAGGYASLRWYPGNEVQEPDPLITTFMQQQYADLYALGHNPAHAYRDRAYVMLSNFNISRYGAIPNFSAIIRNKTHKTAAEILTMLAVRSGVNTTTELDVTALEDKKVRGLAIINRASVKQISADTLARRYPFDWTQKNGKLTAIMRGGAALYDIPAAHLGFKKKGGDNNDTPQRVAVKQKLNEADLPRRVEVKGFDPSRDFEVGTGSAKRQVTTSKVERNIEVNMALTLPEMREMAQRELDTAWLEERQAISFSIPHVYGNLVPTDVVNVNDGASPVAAIHQIRVKEITGSIPGSLEVVGTPTDAALYVLNEFPPPTTLGGLPPTPATVIGTFINSQYLRDREAYDAQPGFYTGCTSLGNGEFLGAQLVRDRGAGYEWVTSFTARATIGTAATQMNSGSTSVTVDLYGDKDLPDFTTNEMSTGSGWVFCGNEAFQYQTATPVGGYTNRWQLTGLTSRGGKGSAGETNNHAIGERFIVLDGAIRFVSMDLGFDGVAMNYKFVAAGMGIADAAVVPYTWNLNNQTPSPPASVSPSVDGLYLVWRLSASPSTGSFSYRVKDGNDTLIADDIGLEWKELLAAGVTSYTRRFYSVNAYGVQSLAYAAGSYSTVAPDPPTGVTVANPNCDQLITTFTPPGYSVPLQFEIARANDGSNIIGLIKDLSFLETGFPTTSRTINRYVRSVATSGNRSSWASGQLTISIPPAPTLAIVTQYPSSADISITGNIAANLVRQTRVQISTAGGAGFDAAIVETKKLDGKHETVSISGAVSQNATLYVKAFYVDAFTDNLNDQNRSAELSIGFTQFVTGDLADSIITAVKLATDAVTASKIQAGAVSTAKFASGIEPVAIVTSVPETLVTQTVFNTTDRKLYKWNGSAYVVATPTAFGDLTGQITETQIATDAITTPKLAANCVTAAEIAANTITAAQIAADTITGGQIAAGAISADEIAAGAIRVDKLAVGTFGGNLILNPSFESGSDGWVGYQEPTYGLGVVTQMSDAPHGDYAIRLANNKTCHARVIAVVPGKKYLARCRLRSTDGTGTHYVGFREAADKPSSGYIQTGYLSTTWLANGVSNSGITSWSSEAAKTFIYTVPTGIYWVCFEVYHSGNGYLDVDDVEVSQLMGNAWIAEGAIGSAQIIDAAILTAKINDLAVIEGKIANLAVATGKIQDLAVTNAKIAALAVDNAKIANATITMAKVGSLYSTDYSVDAAGFALLPGGTGEFNSGIEVKGVPLTEVEIRAINSIDQAGRWRGNDTGKVPVSAIVNPQMYVHETFPRGASSPFYDEERSFVMLAADVTGYWSTDSSNADSCNRAHVEVFDHFGNFVAEFADVGYFGKGMVGLGEHNRKYADPLEQAIYKITVRNRYGYSDPIYWKAFTRYTSLPTLLQQTSCPLNLAATPSTDKAVTLTWQAGSSVTVYKRQRGLWSGGWISVATSQTSPYTVTGLAESTWYDFKVSLGSGNDSNIVMSQTKNVAPVAATYPAPSGLTGAPNGANPTTQISLSWTRNASDNNNVEVYKDGSLLSTEAASATSYTATSLTAGQSYVFKVRNKWTSGPTYSDYSNEVTVATQASAGSAQAPNGLVVDDNSVNASYDVDLSWTNHGATGNITVQRKTGIGGTYTDLTTTLPSTTTTYDDSTVVPGANGGQWYYYRVKNNSISEWSNEFGVFIQEWTEDPYCVTLDTLVLTFDPHTEIRAWRPIGELSRGDIVVTVSPLSGKTNLGPITAIEDGTTDHLFTVEATTGERVSSSPTHPYCRLGTRDTWAVCRLQVGDQLMRLGENDFVAAQCQVAAITVEQLAQPVAVRTLKLGVINHTFVTAGLVSHNVKGY